MQRINSESRGLQRDEHHEFFYSGMLIFWQRMECPNRFYAERHLGQQPRPVLLDALEEEEADAHELERLQQSGRDSRPGHAQLPSE